MLGETFALVGERLVIGACRACGGQDRGIDAGGLCGQCADSLKRFKAAQGTPELLSTVNPFDPTP